VITTIDLLRHGEVEGGACYRGRTDHPLTAQGFQQMHEAVAKNFDWQVIVSSPLRRCVDFASLYSEQNALPRVVVDGFQEIDFGDWEGKTADQLHAEELMRFYQPPFHYAPPNGESVAAFQQRIENAWQSLLQNQRGKKILLITHAGVIRMLFSFLLKIPLEKSFAVEVSHASLTRFTCFHGADAEFVQFNFHRPLFV
jgi:alpha-ribazole phosphatase